MEFADRGRYNYKAEKCEMLDMCEKNEKRK